ncbi:sugar transporter [Fusarium heterosporum]|uniref:Sugar transporter n=1 Tax=Fusarium heterosporum TaxID=42747 RepID=A0A8H5TNJ9_FUSHE|nr:sugar transporter [Fusarium heterosporum]
MAIRHILNQDLSGHDGIEKTAITLLVCYLFTCFDHLAGNDVQAMKHLHGGVELSRNLDKLKLDNAGHIGPSDLGDLVVQVTSQIRRLDMQAVMFALDWTPSDIQESTMNQLKPSYIAFRSLAEAADSIYLLVAQAIRLRNTDEQMYPIGKSISPPLHSSPKDMLLDQLETWMGLFENMLRLQHSSCEVDAESNALITLLRLQHKTAWIFTSSYGPGREMEYDAFLPHFQQCVSMASKVVATYEHSSGSSTPTFTPEIGILPVLYIIGAKCRHFLIRREVLDILRRQNTREAAWNSACAARILERIIEIEEGGCGGDIVPPIMDEIAAWQRIEALSWLYVVTGSSTPRLDVTYTFCGVEEIHTEELML